MSLISGMLRPQGIWPALGVQAVDIEVNRTPEAQYYSTALEVHSGPADRLPSASRYRFVLLGEAMRST